MLLENKSVVIYGAGGAIGSAVSRAFAREGADLYIAGRTVASVRALADEVSVLGVTAEAAEVDALDEAAVQRHLDDVAGRTHAIDVLFDAIGMDDVQGTLLVDMPVEHFVQPTFKAMRTKFVTARTAARKMAQRGSGVIMSVTVPPTPMLHNGGFGVACAAVEALWRSLALELGPRGVRFIILRSAGSPDSPGVGETFERHAQAERVSADDFLSDVTRRTMLGRLPTVPEVAEAAALMASDRASAMTGVMANVTSGFWVDV